MEALLDPSDPLSDGAEVSSLQADLTAKRQKRETLRRDYEAALEEHEKAISHIHFLLDHKAASDCRRLTDLMYRKLPAELRQVVYRFLCIEDQPIPVGPYYHFRAYGLSQNTSPNDPLASALAVGRERIDHSEKPDPDLLMPESHIFDMLYVNDQVVCEIREAYFNNNTFSVCNVDRGIFNFVYGRITHTSTLSPPSHTFPGGIVPTWVRTDKVERVPAYRFASKLQIRLKYEHMIAAITQDVPITPISRRETFANECSFLRNTKNSLSPLHCMEAGNKTLDIEIIIMTAVGPLEDKERYFMNMLQSLRNNIYALKYDRKDSKITVIHHDDDISPFPRNITGLWSLTKEQWEYEKQANKDRVTWDADFYLSPEEEMEYETFGGFPETEMSQLLRERWGISDQLKDTRPKWPVKEGKYWPVGNGPPGWW